MRIWTFKAPQARLLPPAGEAASINNKLFISLSLKFIGVHFFSRTDEASLARLLF